MMSSFFLPHLQVPVDELPGVNVFDSCDYLLGNVQAFFSSLGISQRLLNILNILLINPHSKCFGVTQLHLNIEVLYRGISGGTARKERWVYWIWT